MTGVHTTTGRAFVRDDYSGVTHIARELLGSLPESDNQELSVVLQRYAANVDRAIGFDGVWMRSTLKEAIRGDLLDLLRYAMQYRDPKLSAACGRALDQIDRRAQLEASPAFDCAS
jgi:hypothetical protein